MAGDLGLTLNNALSSLRINQQQLSVLSQNIANANTKGYSRQTLSQTAVTLDGTGEGVSAGDITRQVDQYLSQSVRSQNSDLGAASVINDYYTRIQLDMGTPGGNNSIDSYINGFFNAIQSLAQSPQNATSQQNAVNTGVQLATQTKQLATNLQDLQYQTDKDITSTLTNINTDLTKINQLNILIGTSAALGKGTADLEDQRDGLLQDLSQYIDIKTFTRNDGYVNITTGGGVSILDNNVYKFEYDAVGNPTAFNDGTSLSPITITPVDSLGNPTGNSTNIASGGVPSSVTTYLSGGKLAGLLKMRDEMIPNIMSQLDSLTSTVTDQFNAIHNSGSGFPGVNSLTGTLPVYSTDTTNWSGSIRMGVLDQNGQPIPSAYPDETYGMQPFSLDLSAFDTGSGAGTPSVQGIINAINQYYGPPQNKAEVGNLNNIQLVSSNSALPNGTNDFSFGFDLNNISKSGSDFFVTGVRVQTNLGVDITSVTSTIPSITLASTGTYTIGPNSSDVVVKTTGVNDLADGDVVYLSTPPGGPYGDVNASSLGGYFTISNVTSDGFQISLAIPSVTGGSFDVASQTAQQPYASAAAGANTLTGVNGLFTANLSSVTATSASSYLISVDVGVDDGTGNIKTSTVTYRVNNSQPNIYGNHYGAQSADGNGTLVTPTNSTARIATATLVDANGKELPKSNGAYLSTQPGYLKITTANSNHVISIDSLNSHDMGKPNATIPVAATNKSFGAYFQLNDFFVSNRTGVAGSALHMQVAERFVTNPGLMSLGQLSQGATNSTGVPNYTYQLNAGDNSVIQKLAGLAATNITFAATGGVGTGTQTISGYAGQLIGYSAINAATAKTNVTNSQSLLNGLTTQASAVSGVNLDTELANTVIYQNAYSASARVITVVNGLFDTLLQSIR